jgi:glycosyltransferase involved in cell wall biosynthesis
MGLNAYFSISTSNECYSEFCRFGDAVFPVDTFHTSLGALLKAPHVFQIRRKLLAWLTEREVKLVIALMPHVWTPLISGELRRQGMHYAVLMHDAKPHPGDRTGWAFKWLLNDAKAADTVVTLGGFVRNELIKRGIAPAKRIKTVFMPDLAFPGAQPHTAIKARRRETGSPLRVLYFGRLMQYKGLPLFADAMEIVAANKIPIEISVCGEGNLGSMPSRLASLGAVVINRWLSDDEIGQLLACHDVVVLTHTEASQSGVISAALGAGLPVVTTPAGGLAEQVQSRGVGLVSARIDAQTVADCIRTLALDCTLYNGIVDRIGSSANFSMAQFLRELLAAMPSTTGAIRQLPERSFARSADPLAVP